ncbi:hypothetical protein Q7301_05690 [Glaesserella parasuis]|uniref:hypothetical protein n=1 Tax=Glaesserella parasuis TaxID=738 RepID=UPI000415DBD4|nr:hypothetical protein [Glaesserella parasuis]KDB45104.1 hypothetical protein HPS11_10255 [Glaesserella parasuis HPS11]MCT8562563.1 hypothetical protein [Glaesserella parasuis]MDG6241522.1 hypothetical protein [Glaesserella parasuis]MDG6294709.1 hypothetical protein [Glaesserella parasuis]MDP0026295.1 hypothetical protein [Glaesserella parasuis]
MSSYYCPNCQSILKDWRRFSEKSEIDKVKPFECTGLKCGKRWSEEELGAFNDKAKSKNS